MEMELDVGLAQVFVHHWFPASLFTHRAKRSLRWREGEMPLGVAWPGNPKTIPISQQVL